jgi:hypothetical protein
MDNIVIKRQGTFKIVFKNSKKNGVNIVVSRYTGASEMQTNEERKDYMLSEGFILPNNEHLYMHEISKNLTDSLADLLVSKGLTNDDVTFKLIANIFN